MKHTHRLSKALTLHSWWHLEDGTGVWFLPPVEQLFLLTWYLLKDTQQPEWGLNIAFLQCAAGPKREFKKKNHTCLAKFPLS